MLKIGDKAPEFSLKSTNDELISLDSLKGKKVILYFYPKDDTPGCTKEACSLRDNFSEVSKYAEVFGVSADSTSSHKSFSDKYKLPFQLLSDPDKQMIKDYGVWTEKSMFGKKYFGIQRATFFINEDGIIEMIWPKVNPLTHTKEILKELSK